MKLKHLLLLILIISIKGNLFCQVLLEKTFTSEVSGGNGWERFNMGYLPDYGYVIFDFEFYQYVDVKTNKIKIYDRNYNLIKEIDCISLGESYLLSEDNFDKRFNIGISQYIFNSDPKIEFIMEHNDKYMVYNEDLDFIQELPYGYYGDGAGLSLVQTDDESPIYKLKAVTSNECFFYKIARNPFVTPNSTQNIAVKSNSTILMTISQNPSSGLFKLKLAKNTSGKLFVFDINGKLIRNAYVDYSQNNEPSIDIRNEPDGIYLCSIITDKNVVQSVKVVKGE